MCLLKRSSVSHSCFLALAVFGFSTVGLSTPAQALPFRGTEIVMSAASPIAVQNAQKVAEAGGNVVDVAVALVLNMSVTHSTFAALGGGGFALVRMGKNTEVLDFRERAPNATSPNYFKSLPKEASVTGGAAVAVPGLPAGLWALHQKYGKLHWSRLFDSAILLAQKGYRVSGDYAEDLATNASRFNSGAKKHFLKADLTPYRPGELHIQKNLAKVLSEMRNRNTAAFYDGRVAKDIVDTVRAAGGTLTLQDLRDYKVVWRAPLTLEYEGHKIYMMPPPSSGGIVMATALKLIEKLHLKELPERGYEEAHLLGQVLSRAFRSRTLVADPDYVSVPTDQLLSSATLDELYKSISRTEAKPLAPIKEAGGGATESAETTHLSVLDKFGNAVSMTITLNGDFGSAVATEGSGIMLNNEMDDFTTRPDEPNMYGLVQGKGNSVAPGKRPLSSMSPTLVEKGGRIVMAIGAPGGPRIISAVTQTLYRTLGRKQSLESAIESPRVHHQLLPDKLFLDKGRFTPEALEALRAKKNIIEESWQARVFGVQNINGILEGVVDTRGEGAAAGF